MRPFTDPACQIAGLSLVHFIRDSNRQNLIRVNILQNLLLFAIHYDKKETNNAQMILAQYIIFL